MGSYVGEADCSSQPKVMWLKIKLINGRWRSDSVHAYKVMTQLRAEAGLASAPWPDPPDAYDRLLTAAGEHGIGLEANEEETEAC